MDGPRLGLKSLNKVKMKHWLQPLNSQQNNYHNDNRHIVLQQRLAELSTSRMPRRRISLSMPSMNYMGFTDRI